LLPFRDGRRALTRRGVDFDDEGSADMETINRTPGTRTESDPRHVEEPAIGRVPQNQCIRDVMTPRPCTLRSTDSVMEAAVLMRDHDIGDVVVLENERIFGILTDRDIVVRVLAEGADASAVKVGEICSRNLTTIDPMSGVGDAVRIMRDKAIRRLPVVEESGAVVGVVSIGDIAVARDRRSALGDISAAAPNI
jgi:CBS domain-containing protein